MEYIVTLSSINHIEQLTLADAFLIGNKFFANRLETSFNQLEIKHIIKKCRLYGKKLYILINKIFSESELNKLQKYMVFLKEIKVDGLFFSDFAVFNIAKQLSIDHLLYFYHETFLRNSTDVLAYNQLGIPRLIFSKDAQLVDITSLPVEKKSIAGLVVHGFFPIYYSKRKVLSHHFKFYKIKNISHSSLFYLKEKNRNDFYPLIENQAGTIIFNPKPLSYYPFMQTLKKHISFIIIDGLFEDFKTTQKTLNQYKQLIDANIVSKDYDENQYTTGFLIQKIGME